MKQINIYEPRTQLFEPPIVVKNRQCKICGIGFSWQATDYQHGSFPDNGACGNCQFWLEKFMLRNDPNVARIAGQHYIIGEPNSKVKGMGGAKVKIHFYDGRTVETDNLWHQGQIPATWAEWLPDNATFIERGL